MIPTSRTGNAASRMIDRVLLAQIWVWSPTAPMSPRLELHRRSGGGHGGAVGGVHGEEGLVLTKAEQAGEQDGRELGAHGVELGHRIVEEAAGGGQLVLDVRQFALQLQEV